MGKRAFVVIVPMVDNEPLLNAVSENETEANVNLGLIDLTDDQLNNVVFKKAQLVIHD